MQPLVVLDKIVFGYGRENDQPIFHGLSMALRQGEFRAVLGPNGTGKSTLAKLICGIIQPTQGEVRVAGVPLEGPAASSRLSYRVGLVFQNPDHQIIATSVAEEVAFGPCNLQLPAGEVRKRVREALERFNLEGLAEHPPQMLSGGEKRRLTLAATWAMQPDIWVLDEPLAMLDPPAQDVTLELIREIHREGKTVIYFGHRVDEVLVADLVSVLFNGGIVWEGEPRELILAAKEEWGLTLPETGSIWQQITGGNSNFPVASVEELVAALWGST